MHSNYLIIHQLLCCILCHAQPKLNRCKRIHGGHNTQTCLSHQKETNSITQHSSVIICRHGIKNIMAEKNEKNISTENTKKMHQPSC